MAFFRALESPSPPRKRLFSDPYAACFLRPGFRRALRIASIPVLGRAIPWLADAIVPGACSSGIARTHWIDDALVTALAKGIRQVVILGAGFDCRAFRIPELRAAKIFAVDHPQTFATKREQLAQFIEREPANLTFVQIDFNRQSLEEDLRQAGFDLSQPSIFLWEGVTNYLTAEAVASKLRFIASCAAGTAPPSTIPPHFPMPKNCFAPSNKLASHGLLAFFPTRFPASSPPQACACARTSAPATTALKSWATAAGT